jgi:hypothetical protein
MNMGNGRVYYCRLGRAANLGKVGKESSEVKKAPIECLSSLAFDSIVCGTPLSGVGSSRGLALALRIGRARRAGR